MTTPTAIRHTTNTCPMPAEMPVLIEDADGAQVLGRAGDFDWSDEIDPEGRVHAYTPLGPVQH